MSTRCLRRFILVGDMLEPGNIRITDPRLATESLFVEVRRSTATPLPFEHLKELSRSCGSLVVDPFASEHAEVIDCLMLGAEEVCIDAGSPERELELAYAASSKVRARIWLESWPPNESEAMESHFAAIASLSELIGRKAVATSTRKGVMEKWWADLPEHLKDAFDWWLAPAEGNDLKLGDGHYVQAWILAGDGN